MNEVIDALNRYMAQKNLNRAKLAAFLGVSPSTIDKLLSGHMAFSDKILKLIDTKTGIAASIRHRQFDFEVSRPERHLVRHLEGQYQAVMPSLRSKTAMSTYGISVAWDEILGTLVFEEINNELSPKSRGVVSVPLYNRMMYLLSCSQGNFRLMILSDAYESGVFYGLKATVGSEKMVDKVPTSVVFAMRKVERLDQLRFGAIEREDCDFERLNTLLDFARKEGFFRAVP